MARKHSGGILAVVLGSVLTLSSGLAVGIAHAQAPATPPPAPAAAPAPAPSQKLVVSGLFDGYFNYQFRDTSHLGGSNLLPGLPEYNERQLTPTLSLAELNLVYAPPANGGFGAKGTFIAGDTADINAGVYAYGGNTTEARYKNIQQLYATYATKADGSLDFGKFYTPFGYEVVESNLNYNYSRSDIFTDLLPVYHAGFRYTSPLIAKGLTVTGILANSINDTGEEGVHDDHSGKAGIGSLNWTDPKGKFTLVETFGYSPDKNLFTPLGTAAGTLVNKDDTTISDTDFTYNVNAANTVGLNYTFRRDYVAYAVPLSASAAAGNINSNGYAVYYRNQLTKRDAVALRFDGIDTKDGTKAFNGSAVPGAVTEVKPDEVTATYEIKYGSSWLTRLEYRHDWSNLPAFVNDQGAVTEKYQDLLTVGVVYTFGG